MSVSKDSSLPRKNRLLAALPDQDYQRLIPHLELVSLPRHQVLYDVGEAIAHVYFLNQGMVSLVSIMTDGAIVEVGLTGREGMVGMPVCWGGNATNNQGMVQIPGTAMRMKAKQLVTEFNRGGSLQSLLLRYTQALFSHTSQTAACNRLHTLEERFARWLLIVQDRMQSDDLMLTQEFISHMLGTRRSGVTVAASTLSQAGIIRYSRGKITILNQENLEATSCECYGVIKDEFARLLGTGYG
jgi:CRP-like cAMP-binding protein